MQRLLRFLRGMQRFPLSEKEINSQMKQPDCSGKKVEKWAIQTPCSMLSAHSFSSISLRWEFTSWSSGSEKNGKTGRTDSSSQVFHLLRIVKIITEIFPKM